MQNWFAGEQRTLATVTLAMSSPLGVLLTQFISPLIVTKPEYLPTLNWVVAVPALATLLLFVISVNSSYPPTPPSPSAKVVGADIPYWQRYSKLLKFQLKHNIIMIITSKTRFYKLPEAASK